MLKIESLPTNVQILPYIYQKISLTFYVGYVAILGELRGEVRVLIAFYFLRLLA